MKRIIEGLVILAVVSLVGLLIVIVLKSDYERGQRNRDCDHKCGTHKSFVIFDQCNCQTDKGWELFPE